MKIAMITNNYKPFIGGVPISVERLANGLINDNNKVTIFAPTYEKQENDDNVIRIKSYKRKLGNENFAIPSIFDKKIYREFERNNYDIIHVHHPVCLGLTALYIGKKYNIPVAFTYHTRYEQYLHNIMIFNKFEKLQHSKNTLIARASTKALDLIKNRILPSYIRWFTSKCEMIISPSDSIRNYLKTLNVSPMIKTLPTGINDNFFEENDDNSKALRATLAPDKKHLFCTVSRLSNEKNVQFIIEGIKLLRNTLGNNFKLIVIGNGPQKQELEDQALNLGINENISFLNCIPNNEISNYYKACDLFLFASKSETQGIVLLEAMASRVPVIAIKATGVEDVVINGVNGYMCNESVNEWVDNIIEVINNKSLHETLKAGALATAQKYSCSHIAQTAVQHYEKTIQTYKESLDNYEIKNYTPISKSAD